MTTSAPPPATLTEVPAAVGEVLEAFFADAIPVTDRISPVVGDAARAVADFVRLGGKRVRPTFCYAGWLCGTSSPTRTSPDPAQHVSDALRVCAATELVQACALIHDDIIDHSDTRRGRPTLHRAFEQAHRDAGWPGDAADHGIATAILAGDFALAWADDLVHGRTPAGATARTCPPVPAEVAGVWAAMRTEVLGGQFLDIVNEVSGDESVDAAYRVMEYKTAAYTVARPLELGARMAGAPAELISQLASVGHDLGIAFQLRDDLLGVFGDPALTGKPSGDDLTEGKRTALLALGLGFAAERSADLATELRALVGRPLTDDEVARARAILVDVGAVNEVESRIAALLASAIDTLEHADIDDHIRTELIAMGGRIAHREA